jgi:hypothetical protein
MPNIIDLTVIVVEPEVRPDYVSTGVEPLYSQKPPYYMVKCVSGLKFFASAVLSLSGVLMCSSGGYVHDILVFVQIYRMGMCAQHNLVQIVWVTVGHRVYISLAFTEWGNYSSPP